MVAEIREAHNTELARTVGGEEVQLVLADDLISRILVQSTRQSGLSGVFAELLGFEGSEIYTHEGGRAGRHDVRRCAGRVRRGRADRAVRATA